MRSGGRSSGPATSTTCAERTIDNHAALLCVQTKSTLAAPKMTFETNEFYLRSSEEMADAFAEWPEAIASTLEIAERCDVELELGRQLIPSFECPGGAPEREYLRELVLTGLRAPLRRPGAGRGAGAGGVSSSA